MIYKKKSEWKNFLIIAIAIGLIILLPAINSFVTAQSQSDFDVLLNNKKINKDLIKTILELLIEKLSFLKGDEINIKAYLSYEDGFPASGKEINFYSNDILIDSELTNEKGLAEIYWDTSDTEKGIYRISAIYFGDNRTENSSDHISINLEEKINEIIIEKTIAIESKNEKIEGINNYCESLGYDTGSYGICSSLNKEGLNENLNGEEICCSISEEETAESTSGTSYGPNWETICDADGNCQTIIYSYQKYWLNENNEWEEIDESFDTINCDINYDFCVDRNLYQVHAKQFPDTAETIKYVRDGSAFRFQPFTLNYRNANDQLQQISIIQGVPISVNDNQISYPDAFVQGTDLNYVYLPRTLKQELIIANNLTLPVPEDYIMSGENVTLDIDFQIIVDNDIDIYVNGEIWNQPPYQDVRTSDPVLFKRGDEVLFIIPKPIAFDNQGEFVLLEYELKKQGNNLYIILKTSYEWLVNTAEYPVVIDPTITLNYSDEIWDVYVKNDSGSYTRFDNPKIQIKVGADNSTLKYRAALHWDISSIPDNSNIDNVTLSLHIKDVTCGFCPEPTIMHTRNMEKDEQDYPNNNSGNQLFYDDMGNGTIYNSHTFVPFFSGNVNLSMSSQGNQDFENSLGDDEFSFGFGATSSELVVEFRGRGYPIPSERPKLIVTYGANETDSDAAIEQGINNSLVGPNNPIETNQQIYLLNETGGHFLGTFDKTTIKNNQTWAFNYVTSQESFINMPSLFNILNVWENQSLTYDEIVSQVETFINNTII